MNTKIYSIEELNRLFNAEWKPEKETFWDIANAPYITSYTLSNKKLPYTPTPWVINYYLTSGEFLAKMFNVNPALMTSDLKEIIHWHKKHVKLKNFA